MDSVLGALFILLALLAAVLAVWVVFVRDVEPRPREADRIEPIIPRSLAAMRDTRARRGIMHARPKDS